MCVLIEFRRIRMLVLESGRQTVQHRSVQHRSLQLAYFDDSVAVNRSANLAAKGCCELATARQFNFLANRLQKKRQIVG